MIIATSKQILNKSQKDDIKVFDEYAGFVEMTKPIFQLLLNPDSD